VTSLSEDDISSQQVQRLKLDTEAAMLKLDQILKASELSFSLVAALPGMAAAWLLLTACTRYSCEVQHNVTRYRVSFFQRSN
jgi:nuclear-control-of-ATPase protein 2